MAGLVDYFVPAHFPAEGLQRRQARIAVQSVFALLGWGPVACTLYYVGGSPAAMWAVAAATVTSALTPFLLKWTGSLNIAGNFLIFTLYALFTGLSTLFGGLHAPPVNWLLLMPVYSLLFFNARTAIVWMVVAFLTWGGFIGAELFGHTFPYQLDPRLDLAHRAVGVLGLSSMVFAVILLKDHLQGWLVDTVRATAAETRAVLETAPDGILTLDLEGRVLNANNAAARILGRDREALLGKPIDELVISLDAARALESAAGAFGLTEEHSALSADDRVFPAEIAFGALEGSARDGVVLVMRDITERKEADLQLRQARDEAIEASLAKSTFLANMSHELRTPLNAVIGYSEMLMEEIQLMSREPDDAPQQRVEGFLPDLRRIRTAGKHLLMIISDILDLSKIEAGKMTTHVEPFETRTLLDEICDTVRPLAEKNANRLLLDIDGELGQMRSDATKVRQVLFNLLSNACKFTHEGQISLHARRCVASDQMRFEVRDTGIGMSPEQLERVFDAFTQADTSTTRQFGGTGLGLTITRHFCDLLGGDIQVSSAPGEGTRVSVRMATSLESTPSDAPSETLPA
ncbi:PAS domain S-box protein [Lujinxingia vulgaris]|uniref:histidine kinase n=1 Tax=Lujinxingia vulgaris TaxID=2600176 RepID=A0A5C6XK20_9DELT|nr:ATP-binding protein [Lujinxingia vulgaris]TXD40799.1 PAS domain S-box protein [Lujinxingia vulgaris]